MSPSGLAAPVPRTKPPASAAASALRHNARVKSPCSASTLRCGKEIERSQRAAEGMGPALCVLVLKRFCLKVGRRVQLVAGVSGGCESSAVLMRSAACSPSRGVGTGGPCPAWGAPLPSASRGTGRGTPVLLQPRPRVSLWQRGGCSGDGLLPCPSSAPWGAGRGGAQPKPGGWHWPVAPILAAPGSEPACARGFAGGVLVWRAYRAARKAGSRRDLTPCLCVGIHTHTKIIKKQWKIVGLSSRNQRFLRRFCGQTDENEH